MGLASKGQDLSETKPDIPSWVTSKRVRKLFGFADWVRDSR